MPSPLAGLLDRLAATRARQVLTHRSWVRDRTGSYERLELLGDAVLQLVVTGDLMRRHPTASEGDLAWMRQGVVSRATCARAARTAGLPDRMREVAPDEPAWRHVAGKDSVAGALAEAVIGAAYLDLGAQDTEAAVLAAFADALDAAVPGERDAKTTLQEHAQRDGRRLRYELMAADGPAHRRRFTSRVILDDRELAVGEGSSKQSSQQRAAEAALRLLAGGEV